MSKGPGVCVWLEQTAYMRILRFTCGQEEERVTGVELEAMLKTSEDFPKDLSMRQPRE